MNLQALKTELSEARYRNMSDEQVADSLNVSDRPVNADSLQSGMLVASIVRAEFSALSPADKDYVRLIAMAETMPITATLKTELGSIFPANSQTRTNLVSLLKRTGSRAEELGLGIVTPSHVADAKRLP